MGRTRQTDKTNAEVKDPAPIAQTETEEAPVINVENPESANDEVETPDEKEEPEKEAAKGPDTRVLDLMRLYPQYEEMWITPEGFVRPKGVAKYLIKGATLYKNQFFKK